MIKQIAFTIVFLLFVWGTEQIVAQNPTVCRLGFTYEISQSPNWGTGKPVITSIYPYSSAEQMGLKPYDIINAIDGVSVTDIKAEDIPAMLNPSGKNEVLLNISNLSSFNKQVNVRKECKRRNVITEEQLAAAFAMYSLETTSDRQFICPFNTTVTTDPVDFSLFNTFAFTAIDENNQKMEEAINAAIEKELTKKGLTIDANEPDMLVQTFYFFNKNPNFVGKNQIQVAREPSYRYNFMTNLTERYPFLNYAAAEAEAEYLLQFGFRFIDQKFEKGRVLWECEANEKLEAAYRLENYAQTHVPLMCLQYPYVKYAKNPSFGVTKKTYNYTGISYDITRMELVAEVDRASVAYAAGIRARDVIEKIDNHPMNYSVDEFSAAYKQFVTNTIRFRDVKTLYTDANGFKYCMLWDRSRYAEIADYIQRPSNRAAFSYLYKFAPYVNPSGGNACTFHIKRGNNKIEMIIRPTVRTETTVVVK